MRLSILSSVCLSLAMISVSANSGQFSRDRDLPPLKLAATDLDKILHKTHSFIAAANGPYGARDSGRESVKLGVRGREIEIPHFSLASSVAFPKEVFRFAYTYYQPNRPISSVTIDLSDSSRQISISGEDANRVEALSNLLANDLLRHSTVIGGAKFRRVAGACLLVALMMSLVFSSAYCWNTRSHGALGMPICSALGLMLVLFVPWHRFLPGFVLYQSYSPFFLIRHAREIWFLGLVAALLAIPLSYFLARRRERA